MRATAAILAILEEEQRVCERLEMLAAAQRAALLASDVEALAPPVRETEGLIQQLDALERKRLKHVVALTGGQAGVNPALSALDTYFDGEEREQLRQLGHTLREQMLRIRDLSEGNAALIRQAHGLAANLARLLSNALPKTYAPSGAVLPPPLVRTWSA
jgi:flagellar biosynthesis/type III secretory pathway chaperone